MHISVTVCLSLYNLNMQLSLQLMHMYVLFYIDAFFSFLGEYVSIFELPSIRDREIFAAFNVDTHPAHLFR